MNYGQLKAKVIGLSHRKDMAPNLDTFINDDARTKINSRLGLELVPLVLDTDTNDVLTNWPLIYVYAAMQSLWEFVQEGENAGYYDQQWTRETDRYYVTNPGTTTPLYMGQPPVEPLP